MLDPSRAITNAPIDHEPLTPEEVKALDEARDWSKRNPGIPHEQVLADLGITQKEINRFKNRSETDRLDRTRGVRRPPPE